MFHNELIVSMLQTWIVGFRNLKAVYLRLAKFISTLETELNRSENPEVGDDGIKVT